MTQQNMEVQKFIRNFRARIKIIQGTNNEKLEKEYFDFINHIYSYGATVKGCKCQTIYTNQDNVYHTMFVFYELPANVTAKNIEEYKETEALKQKLRESIAAK